MFLFCRELIYILWHNALHFARRAKRQIYLYQYYRLQSYAKCLIKNKKHPTKMQFMYKYMYQGQVIKHFFCKFAPNATMLFV